MLSILAETYYIQGVKRLTKSVSRKCVTCQRVYARTAQQLMGQLPADRVTPAPPFATVGLDFAGPFLCKRGNPRKPTLVKTYACIYICFVTKAVHLELVSDLTSAAFLASFCRFTGRRGCPAVVYSDNGTNFKGAWGELKQMQDMLASSTTQDLMHHHATEHQITWKFSPSRALHFGGLWEAGVKSMKTLLHKIAGTHHLTYEDLSTVLIEAEATLNSLPLLSTDSIPEDGVSPLTPGHFLIGRPLHSPPLPVDTQPQVLESHQESFYRHLAEMEKRLLTGAASPQQMEEVSTQLQPGDIVLLKELDLGRQTWPMARFVATHPGKDELTRVMEIFHSGKTYRRPIHKLVLLVPAEDQSAHLLPREDVRA